MQAPQQFVPPTSDMTARKRQPPIVWHDPVLEHANNPSNHDWLIVFAYIGCLGAVAISLVVYKYYMIAESDKLYRAWTITIAAFTFIMLVVTVSVRRFFDRQITAHMHVHWIHPLHSTPQKAMHMQAARTTSPLYLRRGGFPAAADDSVLDPLMPRLSWTDLLAS